MTQGFGGFHFLLDGGCGSGAGCRVGAGPGFRCVLFCLKIMMKIKRLNSIKQVPSASLESLSGV